MRQRRIRGRRLLTGLIALACVVLSGCGAAKKDVKIYQSLEDFNGKTIGMLTGSLYDQVLGGYIEDLSYHYYDNLTTQLEALKKGDVEALALDSPVAQIAAAQRPWEFTVFPEVISHDEYSMILKKGGAPDGAGIRSGPGA